MIRSIITVLVLFFCSTPAARAQLSIGGTLDFYALDASKDKPFNKHVNIGLILKKNITPTLNAVTGATIRFFDSNIRDLSHDTDLVTFTRDSNEPYFFYITERETFRFSYVNVPVGLEYKITTWLRLSYLLENNFLIRASEEVDEFMQFGKKALNPYMISHNVQLLLHPRKGFGVGIGCVFNPGIIRKDLPYSYQFMSDYQQRLSGTYCINVSFWADARFIKRKHAL